MDQILFHQKHSHSNNQYNIHLLQPLQTFPYFPINYKQLKTVSAKNPLSPEPISLSLQHNYPPSTKSNKNIKKLKKTNPKFHLLPPPGFSTTLKEDQPDLRTTNVPRRRSDTQCEAVEEIQNGRPAGGAGKNLKKRRLHWRGSRGDESRDDSHHSKVFQILRTLSSNNALSDWRAVC